MTLVRCHHLVDGSAIKPLYRWFESYPYEGYFILIISPYIGGSSPTRMRVILF